MRALFLLALLAGCAASPTGEAPNVILYGGKGVTVDAGFSIAQAGAIPGDRIIAVGDDARVRSLAGAGTREMDLAGRTVIPGLMDGHLHNAGGGPGIALAGVRTVGVGLAAIEARAKAAQAGEIIASH